VIRALQASSRRVLASARVVRGGWIRNSLSSASGRLLPTLTHRRSGERKLLANPAARSGTLT
jgi:hypothetical protein